MASFDMKAYSKYNRELCESPDYQYTAKLSSGDWKFDDSGVLLTALGIPPLAPNNRLLLETVKQLDPESVFELGCGNGDNLWNISGMMPLVSVGGIDASPDQLKWLKDRSPDLADAVHLWDAGWPFTARFHNVASIAFSLTVLMHLDCQYAYLNALSMLFSVATEHVVLIENWETHHFPADIVGMNSRGMLTWSWKNLKFYYREAPEFGRPQIMIVSTMRLPYPKLPDVDAYEEVFVKPQHKDRSGKRRDDPNVFPKSVFGE